MSSPAPDQSSSSSDSDSDSRHRPAPSTRRRSSRHASKRSYELPLYTEIDEDDDDDNEVPKILSKLKGRKRGGSGKDDAEDSPLPDFHPPKPIPRPAETLPTVPAYFTSKYPHLVTEELREMANFDYQKSQLNRIFETLWNQEAVDHAMNQHILLMQAKADLVGGRTAQGGLPSVTDGDDNYVVIRFLMDTPTFEIHHLPPERLQGQTVEQAIGLVDGEILKGSMDIYMTLLNRQ